VASKVWGQTNCSSVLQEAVETGKAVVADCLPVGVRRAAQPEEARNPRRQVKEGPHQAVCGSFARLFRCHL